MNGYSEAPNPGEINDYVRKDLSAKAVAKSAACWNLLGRMRTERICFSLFTALELYGVEPPARSTLPRKEFYVTVASEQRRSSCKEIDFRIWSQPFGTYTFPNGVTCMHPIDVWIQFARYLDLTELVILAESLIRRCGYTVEQFTERLATLSRVTGRVRCEEALRLVQPSDSVQETRTRLVLLQFGLPVPQTRHAITDPQTGYDYVVDMAYPQHQIALEYDGDHHRRFRQQYLRDQHKRRRLRQMGCTVLEVFADDLWNGSRQRALASEVAGALKTALPGRPQMQYRSLADQRLAINARKGEHAKYQKYHRPRQPHESDPERA